MKQDALPTGAAPAPIVSVRDLEKTFALKRRAGMPAQSLRAVRDVSFDIARGETLGLVGESGSGKSTTGRMLVGLIPASAGRIELFGEELTGQRSAKSVQNLRRRVQFVFQDPHGSLNPRMRIGDAIAEPLDIAGGMSRADRQQRIEELLDTVGLPRSCGERFPHEFSGGQRQRISIARALALKPRLLIADEAVSALDVSIQAQVLALLAELKAELGLTMMFITHDLRVAAEISNSVVVMQRGQIVERGAPAKLFSDPQHPYTRTLLGAMPGLDFFEHRLAA